MATRLAARLRPWLPTLLVGSLVVLVTARPALLLPVARAYAALCERFPVLALLTNHAPPLPAALLLALATLAFLAGGWAGGAALFATCRFTRRLHRCSAPVPTRLARVADELGLSSHLTYVALPEPLACCYGVLRPRVAVTAGLLQRLGDAELAAVLGHERAHLRRRDPLRYLVLEAVTAAAFMLPVSIALRERAVARIELAADRAALTIVPPTALAGALLASMGRSRTPPAVAGLTATEARIAHLAGRSELPPVPPHALMASLGLAAITALAVIELAAASELLRVLCSSCHWL